MIVDVLAAVMVAPRAVADQARRALLGSAVAAAFGWPLTAALWPLVLVHEIVHLPSLDQLIATETNAKTLRKHRLASHATTGQVGRIATGAGVKTLVLSRLVPGGYPSLKKLGLVRRGAAVLRGQSRRGARSARTPSARRRDDCHRVRLSRPLIIYCAGRFWPCGAQRAPRTLALLGPNSARSRRFPTAC